MKVCTNLDHRTVTIVLSAGAEVDDPCHHHQSTTKSKAWRNPKIPVPNKVYDYEDNKKEMGAPCFTSRIHTTPVPKGFKLHHHQQKYDGSQETQPWISVILGGSKETAMQILQLHLTGVTRSWLGKLEREIIGSWDELTKQFTSNFISTYKRPTSIEEVKACIQQCNETLRLYIQRWSIIKNSVVDVSDERAIDAFTLGLR
jgi:hypothetical protein